MFTCLRPGLYLLRSLTCLTEVIYRSDMAVVKCLVLLTLCAVVSAKSDAAKGNGVVEDTRCEYQGKFYNDKEKTSNCVCLTGIMKCNQELLY
ncbi:hypothetical protein BsWGS_08709 [Bradybaena similaris]